MCLYEYTVQFTASVIGHVINQAGDVIPVLSALFTPGASP